MIEVGEIMKNYHIILTLCGMLAACPLPAGATSAPSFDISGLRLGMTPDDARRTLQARSRDYQLKDHRAPIDRSGSAPFLSMVTAALPERIAAGPLESYGVQFPPPPYASKAIFIERYGVFKPGQEPLLNEVRASLIKKYGEPSYVDDHARETILVWAFSPAGTQMVEKAVFRRCVRHLPTDPLSLARPNELLYDRQSEGCGLTIYARILRNQIRGSVPMAWGELATLLSISMTDDSQFPAMRLAIKNHQAQGERQASRSFDLEAVPVVAARVTPPAAPPTISVSATEQQAIARPTGSTAGMSDAERARKEELMKRYFSPEARAKLQAEMADKNGNAVAAPDTSIKSDPSITKAKAAGVDTKVFGVPLGVPLKLPRCATANERKNARQEIDLLSAFRGVQTDTTCQSDGSIMAFMGALLGGKPADRYIMLAKDSCPDWAYCEVAASLHEGNLVGIMVMLQKVRDGYVGKQLRAKYGKPTNKETVQYQNDYGARNEVDELEWVLPGLHVAFAPGPTEGGLVIIETETGRKLREAKQAVQEGKQPKL
jgi:hypothetical protein